MRQFSDRRFRLFVSLSLMAALALPSPLMAGLGSKKAAYIGGTAVDFVDAKDPIEGTLDLKDEAQMRFLHNFGSKNRAYAVPYERFIDIEYGQKAGRRVGASIATALLVSPVGLFLLFSKKRKHYVTIGFNDEAGKEQVVVFELGKDIVRTSLAVLSARSGKEIIYQDDEAKKSGQGN